MSSGVAWPDIFIGGLVLLTALRGVKRGFVAEIGGLVAIALAIGAAITYPGFWDHSIRETIGSAPAVSHWIGMGAYAFAVYVLASLAAWAIGRVASLPIIGIANSLLGGLAGALKGSVLGWFIIYGLLFFPLWPQLRADLRRSKVVAVLTAPDAAIDERLKMNVPGFARPVTDPLFRAHHV